MVFVKLTQTYARPDRVPNVSPYLSGQGSRNYLNPAAFKSSGDNVGRQGTATVGSVIGYGTNTFSMSLMKEFLLQNS